MSVYLKYFAFGLALGLTGSSLALASIPKASRITDDTVLSQQLSEIRSPKAARPDFDAEISRLSQLEDRYHEKLPTRSRSSQAAGRVAAPMKRVAKQRYSYSGGKAPVRQARQGQ